MRVRRGGWMLAVLFAIAMAAQQGHADATACASCHKDIVKNFAGSPHDGQAAVQHGNGVTCESCHSPGAAHARNGVAALIFDPAHAAAKDVDEKCLACHEGTPHFERSVHARSNVSCIGCHVIHGDGASRHLLKMKQPELCLQCHADVKAQFTMAFHHKVNEGLINCTDCHDAHGASGEDDSSSPAGQFMACTKCHTATAGPFVYEHAPEKAEGCSACHFSHGGPNPGLLIEANVNTICLRCHSPATNSTDGRPAVPEHVQTPRSEPCTSCHTSIHGSDGSEVFLTPAEGKREPGATPR